MNYNQLTPIIVNIVDFSTNFVVGRYPCNQYKINNEYLSNDASTFEIVDLSENNIRRVEGERVPFNMHKTRNYNKVKIGDYLYVTKHDGGDIVPLGTSALYVGIITNIEDHTITSKSILTMLDVDSVVGLQGMFPYYDWEKDLGYSGSGIYAVTDLRYAMFDCDTILSLIQSIEYALGQTPKLYTYPTAYMQQYGKHFMVPGNLQVKPMDADFSQSAGWFSKSGATWVTYSSNFNYRGKGDSVSPSPSGIDAGWWGNANKRDILIDCPYDYLSVGRGDPNYIMDLLTFGIYYSEVVQEPSRDGSGVYSNDTIRKAIAQDNLPATYGGLGSHSKPIQIEGLWSRLKKWYEEKNVMIVPVIYDTYDCRSKINGNASSQYVMASNYSARNFKRITHDGVPHSEQQMYNDMSEYNKHYLAVNNTYWRGFDRNLFASQFYFINPGESYYNYKRIANRDCFRSDCYEYQHNGDNLIESGKPFNTVIGTNSGENNRVYQMAHIGLKIICMDKDPGYKHAGDQFTFASYNNGPNMPYVFNPIPKDPRSDCGTISMHNKFMPRGRYTSYDYDHRAYDYFYNTSNTGYGGDYYIHNGISEILLCPANELTWCLRINENDPFVEAVTQNGKVEETKDVVLYKSTIGALNADYSTKEKEWTFLMRNAGPNGYSQPAAGDPFVSCLREDEELPVAFLRNDSNSLSMMCGSFAEIQQLDNSTWGNPPARKLGKHPIVHNPVVPLVATRETIRSNGTSTNAVIKLMKGALPTVDSSVNYDIKIYNDVESSLINKWQIRPGQSVVLTLKDGTVYTNLRVLGVNINKDDDFFTVSVGAKSPTLYNEIERRVR